MKLLDYLGLLLIGLWFGISLYILWRRRGRCLRGCKHCGQPKMEIKNVSPKAIRIFPVESKNEDLSWKRVEEYK